MPVALASSLGELLFGGGCSPPSVGGLRQPGGEASSARAMPAAPASKLGERDSVETPQRQPESFSFLVVDADPPSVGGHHQPGGVASSARAMSATPARLPVGREG